MSEATPPAVTPQPVSVPEEQVPTTDWLDGVIKRLEALNGRPDVAIMSCFEYWELITILLFVRRILDQEGSLVECPVPINVIGDIHGQ